jgi:hypothetical protein
MKKLLAALTLLFVFAGAAHAQNIPLANGCGTAAPSGSGPGYQDAGGQACVSSMEPVATFQGTMSVSNSTSTTLNATNATMNNSTVIPAHFNRLKVTNTDTTNYVLVCWFGGTATTASGCEKLAAGASDTVNLGGSTTAPTFLANTAAVVVAFHN